METKSKKQPTNDYYQLALEFLRERYFYVPPGDGLSDAERNKARYLLRYWRQDFYRWQEGVWIRLSDDELQNIVTAYMQALNDANNDPEAYEVITGHRRNEIIVNLRGIVHTPEKRELNTFDGWEFPIRSVINLSFQNGILMIPLDRPELIKFSRHDPNFFNITQLPYPYEPKAKCKNFWAFIDQVITRENEAAARQYKIMLGQWLGYLFLPDLRFHTFLLCYGSGSNGKSVYFDIMKLLVGKDNKSEVPLSMFGDKYETAFMIGKLLNCTDESSHIVESEAENALKRFCSNTSAHFTRKYKEAVNEKLTAKIAIATNRKPRFTDKSNGLWRRVLLVPFTVTIPPESRILKLGERIFETEASGIFNFALNGLKHLLKNNGFVRPDDHAALIEDYRKDSNPAFDFLIEDYIFSEKSFNSNFGEETKELYQFYKDYCRESGYSPLGERGFGKEVATVFPKMERRRLGTKNRVYTYVGVVPIPDDEDEFTSYEKTELIGRGQKPEDEKELFDK